MITSKSKSLPNNRIALSFRWRILFAFFFLLGGSNLQAQGDFFKNVSLVRILSRLEKTYQVTFSYDVSLVKKKRISFFQLTNKSIEKDLVALLRSAELGYDRIDNDIIIKRVPPTYYQKYNRRICGQIIDAAIGLPLGHASVSIANTTYGETADSTGQFVLNFPLVETDYLEVNFIGYETKRIKLSFFLGQPCKTVFLNQMNMEVPQVIVREDYNIHAGIKVSDVDPDVVIIRPSKMTGTGGIDPKDVFGTLKQLPSVNSTDESATSLNIRGGSSGQNLVLYDNIPLYHYGHVFGKISSFNSELIEEVRFSKAGFSAQNGGRVSSVIDIKSKKEIPKTIGIKANIGLLSASISGEIPFANEKAALRLGYRKSIFEKGALNRLLLNQIFQGTRVVENELRSDSLISPILSRPQNSFYDFFAQAVWKPTEIDVLDFTALKMGDKMHYDFATCPQSDCYSTTDNLKLANTGYQASWSHHWLPNFSSSLLYVFSDYDKKYDFVEAGVGSLDFDKKINTINDFSVQANNHWARNGVQVNFGAQYKKVSSVINNIKNTMLVQDTLFDASIGTTNALFVDYRHDIGDKLHLFLGGRLSTYDLLKKGLFLEPRFSVSSNPSQYLKIKMSGGLYYQTMNKLISPDGLSERDELWVLSKDDEGLNKNIFSAQKSTQFSVGMSYRRNGWQANIDVYDKQITGIPSQIVDLQVVRIDELGALKASGLEIGIQKWSEHAFSVASYSRGKAAYDFSSYSYAVNASYHQRHRLTLLQGFKYKNIFATINWRWKSGLPFSEKSSVLKDSIGLNQYRYSIVYDGLNQAVLPSYSRMDLSLGYKYSFSWGKATVNLSAINILNKRNVLNRRYGLVVSDKAILGQEEPVVIRTERNGLPFTPNVSLLFEFDLGSLKKGRAKE